MLKKGRSRSFDSFEKFASITSLDASGSSTSKSRLDQSKSTDEEASLQFTKARPSRSLADLSEFVESRSSESLTSSAFHLAMESRNSIATNQSRSKSVKAKIVLKPKVATTQVSAVTGTKLASTVDTPTQVSVSSTLNMPRFDYQGNVCSQTGHTTIREEKLALKNLFLTLFHTQIRDMAVAKDASNETDYDIRFEAQQEETLGHMICSIALMAIEEMITSTAYEVCLTFLVRVKRLSRTV